MAILKEIYEKKVVPSMVKKFGYENPMQVPKIIKVCVNMGVGSAKKDPKLLDAAKKNLALITGQQPLVTRAKKSIAGFNLRKNVPIGCKVTLRRERMYEFLYKLFNLAIPRIKDFRGISLKGFDHRGNFTLGLQDYLIFPEVEYGEVNKTQGLSITIVTTAKKDEEAQDLLTCLGMPFRKN